jgi:predicted transcriptional regulator
MIAMPASTPKQATLDLVRRLADDASFEDIQYEIYVLQKIEQGLREAEDGETVSHKEARQHLRRWLGDAEAPGVEPRG